MKKLIDALFVVACLCMVVSTVLYARQQFRHQITLTSVRVGSTHNLPQARGKTTLVLELSPSCPHCRANEALYRRLIASEPVRSGRLNTLAIVIDEDKEQASRYAAAIGFTNVKTVKIGENFGIPLQSTPTLALLDPSGKVMQVWDGELHGKDEEGFFAALPR